MRKFHALYNEQSGAYIIISENSLEYIDYIGSGFISIKRGNKKECLKHIEDHWDETDTPLELRMYQEHK